MIFTDMIVRENTITIDGYSNRKTIKGALSDMGRYIRDNVSKSEGEAIIELREESLAPASGSDGGYFLEIEEVPCATRCVNNNLEYAEANYYICCRIVK